MMPEQVQSEQKRQTFGNGKFRQFIEVSLKSRV